MGNLNVHVDVRELEAPPLPDAAQLQAFMSVHGLPLAIPEPFTHDAGGLLDQVWLRHTVPDNTLAHASESYWTDHRPVWYLLPPA
jgi:hypothetical protein